jgi:hypothetical protein
MNDDDALRRLLEEAVSDIEPHDSLSSIHARTKVRSMSSKRSWLLGAGTAVAATAATVVAVAVLSDGGTADDPGFAGPTVTSDGGPSEAAEPTATQQPSPTEPAPDGDATVPVYYLGDTPQGPRLFREFHRVPAGDLLSTAVAAAVGRSPDDSPMRPEDPDYRSPWPANTWASAEVTGDIITVELGGDPQGSLRQRPAGMSAREAQLAVEQLIYTAQAVVQERTPVQFLLYGERTDMLLGVPVSEPLTQSAAEDVLAQVWIITPADGQEVTTPFDVEGLAAAFEATVVWELRDGDRVVEEGFTTARECCTMAPYSFRVSAPPGEYTLVVQNTDPSAGEGPGVWEDTKQVTVLP